MRHYRFRVIILYHCGYITLLRLNYFVKFEPFFYQCSPLFDNDTLSLTLLDKIIESQCTKPKLVIAKLYLNPLQ